MNKKELVETVSKERNLTKKDAEILVDTVFNTITRSVVEGDKVLISGFGTFKVNDRKARKGISPFLQARQLHSNLVIVWKMQWINHCIFILLIIS